MSILSRLTGRRPAVLASDPIPTAPPRGDAAGEYGGPTSGALVTRDGTGSVLLDTDRLTPRIVRKMREHPTITANLQVQALPMLRADWTIACDDADIAELVTTLYGAIHARIIRSMTRALWAGYSPNVLVWDIDGATGALTVADVRDLDPYTCRPMVDDIGSYAGFYQDPPGGGTRVKIDDPRRTLWAVEGMESGNLYGRSLLIPAREAWQAQQTVGLYHLRYLERFGEPVVVARAPEGVVDRQETARLAAMAYNAEHPDAPMPVPASEWVRQTDVALDIAQNLRHHSAVALPSKIIADPEGKGGGQAWTLEYLTAGVADGGAFAEKIAALDRVMSRGMLVPSLLIEGGDAVGSNALGESHASVFRDNVEARLDDYAAQVTEHIIDRLVTFNFGESAPRARLEFAPIGNEDATRLWGIVEQLVTSGAVPVDAEALAARYGIPLVESDEDDDTPAPAEDPEDTLRRVAPQLAAELDDLAGRAPVAHACRRDDDAVVLVAAPADVSGLPEWKRPAAVDPLPWRRELTDREQRVGFRQVEDALNAAEARAIDELVALLEASHEKVARQVQGIMRRGGSVAQIVTALGTVDLGPVAPWVTAWVELQRTTWGAGLESVRRELATFADAVPGDIGRDGLALVKQYAQASADRAMADMATRVRVELLSALRSGVSPTGMLAAVSSLYDQAIRGEGQPPRLTSRMLAAKALNEGRADAIARGGIPLAGAQYSAILDTRTCELCARLDEQLVSVTDLDMMKFTPPVHHNCRCVWVYVTTQEADFVPTWAAPPASLVERFGGLVYGS